MTYLPGDTFFPSPDNDDREFWQNCKNRKLTFQACADCFQLRHPPTPICGNCYSTKVVWRQAPEQAEIFSYTIVSHPAHEAIDKFVPYVVAVVSFENFGPVKLVTNVLAKPERVEIGMKLKLHWEESSDGIFLPRFIPLDDTAREVR